MFHVYKMADAVHKKEHAKLQSCAQKKILFDQHSYSVVAPILKVHVVLRNIF